MKWNYKLCLTTIASLAIILPMSAFAEDQNQDKTDQKKQGKKEAAGQQHGGKGAPQVATQGSTPSGGVSHGGNVHNKGRVDNTSSRQGPGSRVSSGSATVQQSTVSAATSQSVQPGSRVTRNQRNQPQVSSNQQYTRNNNYGGLWFPANTHDNWNRNQQYYWNNHNYRWYQGGWLIIDAGFSPYYSNGGSTVRSVQMRLADQGYYRGPIDGDIGPGTRHAIADYQSDQGLRVTGRINDPLLQSLGLE